MKSLSKLFLLALAIAMLAAIPALADVPPIPMGDWQTASVGVGDYIRNVAVDPVRNRIFTTNYNSNTISVADGRTNEVQTWTTGPGSGPRLMAVNPIDGKLYVTLNGFSSDSLVIFDTFGATVGRLQMKSFPYSMVMDLDSGKLFISNYESDTVTVVRNDEIVASIAVNDAPTYMAFNPVNRMVYLTYMNSGIVTCINCDTYNKTDLQVASMGNRAYSVAVNASVNKAYVTGINEDSVTVIDCAGNAVEKKIPVGASPTSVVCDPAAQMAYVANSASGDVTVIDCSTGVVHGTAAVKSNPSMLAINPVTRKLYVGSYSDPTLIMIDLRSGIISDSVVLPYGVTALALNPVTNKIYAGMEAGDPDSLAVIDGSDFDTTLVATNALPLEAAVNLITGEVYVINANSDNVTVIQPGGDTLVIPVGDYPKAVAVNPLTNKIFVTNLFGKSVSVIDGATHTVERTIAVDTLPCVVAVNPLTNYIYVGSYSTGVSRIKVIDGKDWDTTSVQVGPRPEHIAVNVAANRIYVVNSGANTMSVINAASNHSLAATVIMPEYGADLAVNPQTNKIYVAHYGANSVSIIDGVTNSRISVSVGKNPSYLTVNQAYNKVYVSCYSDSTVWVIDGATAAVLPSRINNAGPCDSDPVTGRVFVCNLGLNRVTVIDCASGDAMSLVTVSSPGFVAVNPAAGKAYVVCRDGQMVMVIDQTVEQDTRVNTFNDGSAGQWAYIIPGSGAQTRSYTTTNRWSPYKATVARGLFSLASSQSFWKFGYNYSYTDTSLTWWTFGNTWESDTAFYGENIIRCFGLETQGATTNNLGQGTPFAGNVLNTMLYRIDYAGPTIAWWDSLADDNDSLDGYGPYTVRAVITDFSGVDFAKLVYYTNKKGDPSVTMVRALADTFVATIPAQVVLEDSITYIVYSITADDHANGSNNAANETKTIARTFWMRNLTGVAGTPADPALPKTFALQAAYPNPSHGQTVIKYQLPKVSNVQLQVYNVAGQLVKTIDEGQKPAGYHQISCKDSELSNGIYFYQLKAGEFSATRKMVVLK